MKRQWSEAELDIHWVLTVQELALLSGRTKPGRFGFAVLLKYFQYEGRFPKSRREPTGRSGTGRAGATLAPGVPSLCQHADDSACIVRAVLVEPDANKRFPCIVTVNLRAY